MREIIRLKAGGWAGPLSYAKQNFQEFQRPMCWRESAPSQKTRVPVTDRLRALELLGKHLKLFTDKVEQDTQITVTIERIGA